MGGLTTTRVGLFLGGKGGVLLPLVGPGGVLAEGAATPAGAFLTVVTLALDPIESLLDAKLSLDGEDVPLRVLCTVEMLSVEADMPLTLVPLTDADSALTRCASFRRPGVGAVGLEAARPNKSP